MSNFLTRGAIKEIADGRDYSKPVFQLLALKKLSANSPSGSGATDRYRLLLSDGVHSNSAMLAVQLNKLIDDSTMELFSVIQLDRFVCNPLPDNRRVMIVLEVSILQPGSHVRNKIGNPVSLAASALLTNQQQIGGPSVVAQRPAWMQQSRGFLGGPSVVAQRPAGMQQSRAHKVASGGHMSQKSSLLQDMSQQLTCSICLDHYTIPKTVTPCLHTFCQQCLQETIDTTATSSGPIGKFPCPKCRGNIEFDCPDLPTKKNAAEKQFQTNFDIQSQLEIIKSKITSGCSKHEGEMLIFFCRSCDQLICSLCLGEKHRYCKFITVKEEAECIRAEVESEHKKVDKEELLSQHRRYLAELENSYKNADTIIACLDAYKADIKDFMCEVKQKKQTSEINIKGVQEYPDKYARLIQLVSGTDDLKLLLERETVSNLRQELRRANDYAPTTPTLPSEDRLAETLECLSGSVKKMIQKLELKKVAELKKQSKAAADKKPKGKHRRKKQKRDESVAKSWVLLDIKPRDDKTDLGALELVRTIVMDGLVWRNSNLIPIGDGMKKLQIQCEVEDDKVSTDELKNSITAFEDFVQSVDIVAIDKM
ncbi:uncharacterized protein [Amphiura filiformis]|uniref:uncharacterized protein isoform X2 n=1 Tax=Amphiura filiformis TaxID=82378 RepID=UPI003B21D61E